MKPQPRSGDHIQRRGDVWHYWRIIPPDCKRTYGKSVESRSLDTMNRTEAKRLAKAIDLQVDRRIREIREASDPAAIADKIAERVCIDYGDGPFRADPRINAYRHIRREVEYAPLSDEGRAKATELAWQKIDEKLTKASVAKKLGQDVATLLGGFAPEQIERCRAGILSLIHYQNEGQAASPTSPTAGKSVFTYSGEVAGIPEGSAPSTLGKSFSISAEVDIPQGGAEGMLNTIGGRFGGYGLYLVKGKPIFTYVQLTTERFRWESPAALTPGKHTIVFDFKYDGPGFGKGGTGVLSVDGQEVASKTMPHTIPFLVSFYGSFDVGVDTRMGVDDNDYQVPFRFTISWRSSWAL
jgi:hypothetical protein